MQEAMIKVEGMSCGHCVQAVEKAVREAGAQASVDLAGKSVTLTYDSDKVTLDALKAAIEEQGYDVK